MIKKNKNGKGGANMMMQKDQKLVTKFIDSMLFENITLIERKNMIVKVMLEKQNVDRQG